MKNEITQDMWAVIRIEGAGHIEALAGDRDNAILKYCWHRISKDPGHDWKRWWSENAKKKNLVCVKIKIVTPHLPGVPYPGWRRPTPKADRCEWDMGHKTICIQQCEAPGKHIVEGRRLCGVHVKAHQRGGELKVIAAEKALGNDENQ